MLRSMNPVVLVVVAALAVVVSACTLARSAAEPRLTALAATRFALEVDSTIRARFPNGKVRLLQASSPNVPDLNGTAREWTLAVSDPATSTAHQYAVSNGRVGLVGSGSSFMRDDTPLIADLAGGVTIPADVMDSDRAIQTAETLGGTVYRTQMGAEILDMDLSGFPGRQLVWTVFYSKPNTDHQATLRIDARTGELLGIDSQDFPTRKP